LLAKIFRSLREGLVDVRRTKSGEEEDSYSPEDVEPRLRRNLHVLRPTGPNPTDQSCRLRHGLRPDWPKRPDRTDHTRQQERTNRDQTLERDVRKEQAAGRQVARPQGLRRLRPSSELRRQYSHDAFRHRYTCLSKDPVKPIHKDNDGFESFPWCFSTQIRKPLPPNNP